MEKKVTKKPVKKAATKAAVVKKSAKRKVVKKVNENEFESNFDSNIYQEFEPVDRFEIKIPRVVYASLSWTYFKLYLKSFFKK
jgi:hypothetical protein